MKQKLLFCILFLMASPCTIAMKNVGLSVVEHTDTVAVKDRGNIYQLTREKHKWKNRRHIAKSFLTLNKYGDLLEEGVPLQTENKLLRLMAEQLKQRK